MNTARLAALLRETEEHHGRYEATAPPHHWSAWYAVYIEARQQGRPPGGLQRRRAIPGSGQRAGGVMTDSMRTGFGSNSTAADVVAGIDLSGKRAIVTGASSGIGVETARALAGAGAAVTLAVRNPDAGHRAAAAITAATGNDDLDVAYLDLTEPVSVAGFAAGWSGPLHLLVNNAGVMALPELELTPQGWEMQLATNHVGHQALALGLHHALATAGGARIVSLSSRGHLRSPVVFDDVNFRSRPYDPWLAYGQSKTANVLFAVGATSRWSEYGVWANAVHPGAIADTNLSRHMDTEGLERARASGIYRYKTIEQGAATTVWAATAPELDGVGGRYFEDCNEAAVIDSDVAVDAPDGVAAYALDPDSADRLWDLSCRMLNQSTLFGGHDGQYALPT